MMFRRVGTDLILDVTNPELLPLFEGNEAYEVIEDKAEEEKPKKTTKKK